jgi:hypothetical protein
VYGSFPDGDSSPYRMETRALPKSCPGRWANMIAVTLGLSAKASTSLTHALWMITMVFGHDAKNCQQFYAL